MLRIMTQKGLKQPFIAHFVEQCAKCSTGNNPRKRLIICFVWELGMSGLLNKKVHFRWAVTVEQSGVFLTLVSCRAWPGIPASQTGRDATCCVRKSEDELAGQARKDTDSEPFANDVQIKQSEVMQKSGVFVAQTNRLVQKNGDTHLFLGATLGD